MVKWFEQAQGHISHRRASLIVARQHSIPDYDYFNSDHKHGYTVTIGRTHADGTICLAREIRYGSPAWKKCYHRRNSAESRNSVLERLGLTRMPADGESRGHVTVL